MPPKHCTTSRIYSNTDFLTIAIYSKVVFWFIEQHSLFISIWWHLAEGTNSVQFRLCRYPVNFVISWCCLQFMVFIVISFVMYDLIILTGFCFWVHCVFVLVSFYYFSDFLASDVSPCNYPVLCIILSAIMFINSTAKKVVIFLEWVDLGFS